MRLHELIEGRRTVHEYAERELPPGALARALQAAVSAPNHGLTEPWRFVRVGPATRSALVAMVLESLTQGGQKPLGARAEERLQSTVRNPAELLIVSQVLDADAGVCREDYAAVSCAIQNLMLALWAEGIGSKWSTEEYMEHPRLYSALGIDSTQERIVGLIWIGYAARSDPRKARRRRSVDDVLRTLP